MYEIEFAEDAIDDLAVLRPFEQARIVGEVEEKLGIEPRVVTRLRKPLFGLKPPWESARPVWQLRVGDFRVFYDVDEEEKQVTVRAVRRKGSKTTKELL